MDEGEAREVGRWDEGGRGRTRQEGWRSIQMSLFGSLLIFSRKRKSELREELKSDICSAR